jgi:hypothetical protein
MSGLIDALINSMPSQKGGTPGSGYRWHRENAIMNLGTDAIARRDVWLNEVRAIYRGGQVPWKQALQQASKNRTDKEGYLSVKDRTIASYKGRNASSVKCQADRPGGKAVCPGRYTKPASTEFRPQGHKNKRVLTQEAAKTLLRDYYRSRKDLIKAQIAMKKDMSTKRNRALEACPVKTITDSLNRTRSIAVKTPECADNWLYKNPGKYDMKGIDHGNKDTFKLHKVRSDKGKPRGPRTLRMIEGRAQTQ